MKSEVRFLNGYRLIFLPTHHRAMNSKNWDGYVYEHIVVAEEYLGRVIRDEEVVHHLNGNRGDNRYSNLLVLEKSQHGRLHAWINSGAIGLENIKNESSPTKSSIEDPTFCEVCQRTLQDAQLRFCSIDCHSIMARTTERPTKNQLKQDIENMPFTKIGKKYGVSDNAVRKWARQYGLPATLTDKELILKNKS